MSQKRVLVLGSGMIGSAMAMDLARQGAVVTVADVNAEPLSRVVARYGVGAAQADLSDPRAVRGLAADHELVIGALPSVLGLQTLQAVIEAGRDYVDISFMPEDPRVLDGMARERGVTAVVDCGVAPGVSNMMTGYAAAHLSPCDEVEIYVGGLPVERRWPYEYKAGFAPSDVLEEYTRPSRVVEHGRIVVKEALSEPELMDFPGVGTLEAFNTDGLRSLADTIGAPTMKEKTLRYPGHIALMRAMRETGLFSKEPISVKGQTVRPLDVTSALLFPKWTFEEGEADLTVMRVTAVGRREGRRTRYTWDLLDRYDPATGLRSMSRTTGFPAVIMAGLIGEGRVKRPGVHPPEAVVMADPGILDAVVAGLSSRGVHVRGGAQTLD